eukprot:TRINITY_DN925_c0_g1_i1.p1 TRINITY_DN925_c0_g1~~TRINITY_DN925_c0_g1_i1.p1  ORF type:complete len:214 (-),score=77.69 TRINITY_DN925_c0_g1_i1:54-647(-)
MFSARQKILKPQEYTPTEVEASMAQALYELQEAQDNSMKEELQDLHFLAAREITVSPSKKAIVVFVPYVELKAYHRIQVRLVRELEKKFSGKHVVVVAQRRIIKKPSKNNQRKMQKRPMSRTKQAVHDAIIEDLCFPTEVVGKRLRFSPRRLAAAQGAPRPQGRAVARGAPRHLPGCDEEAHGRQRQLPLPGHHRVG